MTMVSSSDILMLRISTTLRLERGRKSLRAVNAGFVRIERKLGVFHKQLTEQLELVRRMKAHEGRIQTLETSRSKR